jgi:hypothetical protein
MKALLILLAITALTGCEQVQEPRVMRDQCMRQQIFLQCMAALPAGPQTTMYNDWDEVVSECESAAAYQSLRPTQHIKPECRI